MMIVIIAIIVIINAMVTPSLTYHHWCPDWTIVDVDVGSQQCVTENAEE